MDLKPKTFIFTGRSGCGKGTQAKIVQDILKHRTPHVSVFHMETGARFREFIKGNLYSNRLAKEVSGTGARQPDFLAVWNWAHIMVEELDENEHMIIDGTPRSYEEALVLDSAMTFYRRERPYVIYIDVSSEWSRKRLTERSKGEGRADDQTLESIEKRLAWFETDVMRAIKFFEQSNGYRFIHINGEQSVEKVADDIQKALSF